MELSLFHKHWFSIIPIFSTQCSRSKTGADTGGRGTFAPWQILSLISQKIFACGAIFCSQKILPPPSLRSCICAWYSNIQIFKSSIMLSLNLSLKYQRFTRTSCKDIGIRKLDFWKRLKTLCRADNSFIKYKIYS